MSETTYIPYTAISDYKNFVQYCLRKLGGGIHNIEITDEQIQDRVQDALQYYREFNLESVKRKYISYKITETDVTNGYLTLPSTVLDVLSILQHSTTTDGTPQLGGLDSADFLMRQAFWGYSIGDSMWGSGGTFTSGGLISYELSLEWFNLLQHICQPVKDFVYHQRSHKLEVYNSTITKDYVVFFELNEIVDPNTDGTVFDNQWLKAYCVTLLKIQWYHNLMKYKNANLLGGLQVNDDMLREALQEKTELEEEHKKRWEEPPMFYFA